MLNYLKQQLFSSWGFTRILRLVLGVIILVQAIQTADVMFGLLGSFLLGQAALNIGCCGVDGCGVPYNNKAQATDEKEITYEEIRKDS